MNPYKDHDRLAAQRGDELLRTGDIKRDDHGVYRCACKQVHMVRRVQKNGVSCVGKQCRTCGAFTQTSKRGVDMDALPDYSSEFLHDVLSALFQRDRYHEHDAQSAQWWASYNTYLKTPEWQSRRRRVIERARGVCEACLYAKATQVHHTTYRHVGNEPLWELRAICDQCHEVLTALDREDDK